MKDLQFMVEPEAEGESSLIRWKVVDDSELATEPVAAGLQAEASEGDHGSWDESVFKKINEVLDWKYPFAPATERTAKTSVTALRRETADDEAEQRFTAPVRHARDAARPVSNRKRAATKLNAADAGVAHHKFLQYFAFETATDLKSFVAEAKRLEKEGYLSADETETLDLEALTEFWASDFGKTIRANGPHVWRELAFTAGFKPAELDKAFGKEQGANLNGEMIVVQGIADLVVLLPEEIQLVDFKTDGVTAKDLPEKIAFYSPQLKLYTLALEKIYSRPVTDCRLHFLAVRKTVRI